MELFNLVIIGGGPAGYNAAERAAKSGLKTALVEKRALGGVCLNEGCIPSKSLLYSAKLYEHATQSRRYGVTVEGASIDQKTVIARKNKVVKQLTMGINARMKQAGVSVIQAAAYIEGKKGENFAVSAGEELLEAKNLLICTGSQPVLPPIPGLREGVESGFVMTNREILDLEEIPEKLTVIGGGVIGLEMAAYYNSVGSEVTVIEMLERIAGSTDADISDMLQKVYAKKGIKFCTSCKVTEISNGSVAYETADGTKVCVQADKVLCSVGRRAVTDGLGIENLGVETAKGAIVTDEHMRTNVAGVYAAGDVNGKSMLAHTAYREGEAAVNNILGTDDTVRYGSVPSVIYTNPEVGSVGETLESALKKGIDAECVRVSMRMSGRFLAENEGGDGICKLIVNKADRKIIGVHMIGSYSSEIIYGAAMMIDTELDIETLKGVVFPHPTVCEVIRETLFEI